MKLVIIFLVLFGVAVPNSLHAQYNRISVQTGLFHCFFDGSPLMNVNYRHPSLKPFGGLFYNSLGLQYRRKINLKSALSIEAMLFDEYYWNVHPNMLSKQVSDRGYYTFNVNYDRIIPLSNHVNFTYGVGINVRYGRDLIVVNYAGWGGGAYESLSEVRMVGDMGINLRSGIEYSPWKWLTLYTKFDLLGFVYTHDRNTIKKLKEIYNVSGYPNRFDLSWRFGLGFNFGKVREEKTGL